MKTTTIIFLATALFAAGSMQSAKVQQYDPEMPAKTYSFTCSFTPESGEDSPFFSVSYTLTIRYAKIVGAHVTGSNFLPGAISKYRYKGKEYTPSFRGGVSPFCVSQFKILPI